MPERGIPLRHKSGSSPIEHVVLMVQENRTFNNLFARVKPSHVPVDTE